MDQKFVPPKYLTQELVEAAMNFAYNAVLGKKEGSLFPENNPKSHSNCHIVVLVPSLNVKSGKWPNYSIRAYPFQKSFGDDPKTWKRPYNEIAQCKAFQMWTGRSDGSSICPHLLFSEDTPFWGGVSRDGIIVTCSGQPQHIDRLISGIAANTIQALAVIAYESDPDHPGTNEATNFLS